MLYHNVLSYVGLCYAVSDNVIISYFTLLDLLFYHTLILPHTQVNRHISLFLF